MLPDAKADTAVSRALARGRISLSATCESFAVGLAIHETKKAAAAAQVSAIAKATASEGGPPEPERRSHATAIEFAEMEAARSQ
jgi:hypothetical protein